MSVRGGVHFDLVKRVLRDINRSGQEPEEIIQQISDTVYPMYKARTAAIIPHSSLDCPGCDKELFMLHKVSFRH